MDLRRSVLSLWPVAAVAALAGLTSPIWAGDDDAAEALPAEALAAMKAAGADKKDAQAKRFPDFEEVTKDMKATEGLFTFYRYDPEDKTKDSEKLLCRIPAGMLGKDLLFATSISRGGFFTGWMWTDYLIQWKIVGDNLVLATPNTNYVHNESKPITDVVKRTYTERYLAAVPIVTMAGGDPVVDAGRLLKTDLADVAFMTGGGGFAAFGRMGGGGGIREDLSKWGKIKNFPDNLLIDVDLAVAQGMGGKTLGVSYAFRRLPEVGSYKPRVADDRLGYFLTARVDWSRDASARDTFDRLIQRWDLQKRDPSLELSPPTKPIVFIIEKTVPVQWRRWVRAGIEEWNKAFEKIGFVDAIVVQQQTDDNEFAEYDPEDARYNFFRWIVSGTAFAMGPSRVDPRTGQILDADIIMDDSFIRAFSQDFDLFSPSAVAQVKGPGFARFCEQYPELTKGFLARNCPNPASDDHELFELARRKLQENGREICTYASGFQHQMALAHTLMLATATGKKIPEHLLGEAIKEVVAHEVGHTLGLRHNFKASSWLSLEEVKRRRDKTDEATTGSVMDYNPLLFFKGDKIETVRHFITPTIGPYDYWVIEYGYSLPKDGSEEEMLKSIASRCAEPGLAYLTDEDTMWVYSPDPSTNTYDHGANPVDWVRSRFELADELLKNVCEWSVLPGEPRYFARQAFTTLLFEKARNFEYVGRLLGGQYFHRDHKGDPNARPALVPVDSAVQRQALGLLKDTLFNSSFFQIDGKMLNDLPTSRWSHFDADPGMRVDFPIHSLVNVLQAWTLIDITSPPLLQRIYDAELKTDDPKKVTAAETILTIRDAIWARLEALPDGSATDAKPYLDSITRGLQREHMELMLAYLLAGPNGSGVSADLEGMLRFSMRELSAKIGSVLEKTTRPDGGSKLDFASRAHLSECKSRIDRVLNAQFLGQ